MICDAIASAPDAQIGLPTGDTPIGTYAELARRERAGSLRVDRTTACAIDEFADVKRGTPGTNAAFFALHLPLAFRAVQVPGSNAPDPELEIASFAEGIRAAGGLELCVLGIGRNAHVAFNEPGSRLDSRARVVDLELVSREAHAGAFGGLARVPHRGMTLGIADILEARKLIVLVQGQSKARAVRDAIEGPESELVPASWLRAHAEVTWIVDRAAASMLSHK